MTAPRWNLNNIYPDFNDEKYRSDVQKLAVAIETLSSAISSPEKTGDSVSWTAKCIDGYNTATDLYENLGSYAYTRFSTDTKDAEASKELNKLEEAALPLKSTLVAFRNSLADIAEIVAGESFRNELETRCGESYAFFLGEQLELQKKQMSPAEEDLAEDLARAGGSAWTRQQEAISSTLSMLWDEQTGERKTVIQLRSLAFSPDRTVRNKAFKLETEAWKQVEIPIAFSLNGVKGFSVSLNKRRSYEHSLEGPLMQSRISRETLDALISAMEQSLPAFRRYLKAKAKYLGLDTLRFSDLFAPVGSSSKTWKYDEVRSYIEKQFSKFSPEMGMFAKHAFDNNWIDAESREGKIGGAYCTSFPLAGESRVLCNFEGSFSDLSTIAHELGHAYHHHILKEDSGIHREYPMTLAETASIFAQTLVFDAALQEADDEGKLNVIEEFLQDTNQVIVDILSRFYFEKKIFDERAKADITPDEFCTFMIDAQKAAYGTGLDPEYLHPYMWAVKPHYYSHDLAFYNFPYSFGQLFGLGLFSRYKEEGPSFVPLYDDVLRATGRDNANEVTKQAGFDIEDADFWMAGIKQIEGYIDTFEKLVDQV
ncbi:MAG: M3 family oligoendopeptidase [Spirochaetales bacterium]|jgi:oligoendopeptidase F|nr:M3 family oligoendopeptidase [Spirochaetales bacterium]